MRDVSITIMNNRRGAEDTGPRPAQLLDDLRAVHETILSGLDLKQEVTRSPVPTITHCSLARWNLARARHRRRKVLNVVAAELLRYPRPGEVEMLRRLEMEELSFSQSCSQHVQSWTCDMIARNWQGYTAAALAFCEMVRHRVTREMHLLYPMLADRIDYPNQVPTALAIRHACDRRAVS